MENYQENWLDHVKFNHISYDEFPLAKEKRYYFLEKVLGRESSVVYKRNKYCFLIDRDNEIYKDLYLLDMYKEVLDSKKSIESIIIPGEIVAIHHGRILPINQLENLLKRFSTSRDLNKLINHYPYDILALNNRSVNFSTVTNYLTMFYMHPLIRVPKFFKGDLKLAWKSFLKKRGIEGLMARKEGGPNYLILK